MSKERLENAQKTVIANMPQHQIGEIGIAKNKVVGIYAIEKTGWKNWIYHTIDQYGNIQLIKDHIFQSSTHHTPNPTTLKIQSLIGFATLSQKQLIPIGEIVNYEGKEWVIFGTNQNYTHYWLINGPFLDHRSEKVKVPIKSINHIPDRE